MTLRISIGISEITKEWESGILVDKTYFDSTVAVVNRLSRKLTPAAAAVRKIGLWVMADR